jgi:hypothetical protein
MIDEATIEKAVELLRGAWSDGHRVRVRRAP